MRAFLIGAATIALAASGAVAEPGKGNGGGGNGHAAGGHVAGGPEKGGGQGQGQAKPTRTASAQGKDAKGPAMGAEKGNAGQAKADRGPQAKAPATDKRPAAAKAPAKAQAQAKGGNDKAREAKGPSRQVREVREVRNQAVVRDRDSSRIVRTVGFDMDRNRGLIDGCPPGLAKKNNGCLPPGLAKNRDSYRDRYYTPSWFGYRAAQDGRYYYDDGYLYRVNDGGSVLGYIPLLGGALSIGNPWPNYYQPMPVNDYYSQYYNLGAPNSYRYADDVLYRVDPQSNMITSIAALLTGDQFGVGQPMPAGYDVYNVPYGYQDQYYDNQQANYRYADGYVYQVDPQTQLITTIIQLLT